MTIKKHREKKLDRRTHGYQQVPKTIFRLLSGERALTDEEFTCYLYLLSNLVEYNPIRKIEFGTYDYKNTEIAQGIGWSESKVSRVLNGLKQKGYLFLNEDDLIELTGYKLIFAYLAQYTSKNNKKCPEKVSIPFKEIILYCINNNRNMSYDEAVAFLQEIDIALYVESLDIKDNSIDGDPP